MTIALYPATFDPIHNGHIDIARRAAQIFDEVIAAAYERPNKTLMFTAEERMALMRETFKHIPNIRVTTYDTLTVNFAQEIGAHVMVRGLRVVSDFETEMTQALMNRHLAPSVETVNLITGSDYAFVSSSLVKEVAMLGGDISRLVPPHVEIAVREKLEKMGMAARQHVKMVALSND
jgi:pantetheine-phosphate adenylyltransferase